MSYFSAEYMKSPVPACCPGYHLSALPFKRPTPLLAGLRYLPTCILISPSQVAHSDRQDGYLAEMKALESCSYNFRKQWVLSVFSWSALGCQTLCRHVWAERKFAYTSVPMSTGGKKKRHEDTLTVPVCRIRMS